MQAVASGFIDSDILTTERGRGSWKARRLSVPLTTTGGIQRDAVLLQRFIIAPGMANKCAGRVLSKTSFITASTRDWSSRRHYDEHWKPVLHSK